VVAEAAAEVGQAMLRQPPVAGDTFSDGTGTVQFSAARQATVFGTMASTGRASAMSVNIYGSVWMATPAIKSHLSTSPSGPSSSSGSSLVSSKSTSGSSVLDFLPKAPFILSTKEKVKTRKFPVFEVLCDEIFPLEETLVPIFKRKILSYILQTVKSEDKKNKKLLPNGVQ
jgi:hypothetical protein